MNGPTDHGDPAASDATVSTEGRRPVVRLERVLARLTGDAAAGDAWQQHFDRYTAAFEPALGPQEGPPAGH